jgi:hypothetical protein
MNQSKKVSLAKFSLIAMQLQNFIYQMLVLQALLKNNEPWRSMKKWGIVRPAGQHWGHMIA